MWIDPSGYMSHTGKNINEISTSGGLESFKGYKPKPGERIIPSGRDKGKGAENISLWEYLKPKQNGNGFKITKNIHIPFIK